MRRAQPDDWIGDAARGESDLTPGVPLLDFRFKARIMQQSPATRSLRVALATLQRVRSVRDVTSKRDDCELWSRRRGHAIGNAAVPPKVP